MDKKEFVEKVSAQLDEFIEMFQNIVIELYKKANTPIKKKILSEKLDSIKDSSLDNLIQIYKRVAMAGSQMGIKAEDQEAIDLMNKFEDAQSLINTTDPDKLKSKIEMRAKEPISNLGPIENIKTMTETKEEIGDKILDLDKLKNEAISETEKKKIQEKIDYYMRIYQESKLKGKKV
jgi:hypothetical protein